MTQLVAHAIAAAGDRTVLAIQDVVECRAWDDRFLAVFHATLAIGAVVWLLVLVGPMLRRPRAWWAAQPFVRASVAAMAGVLLPALVAILSRSPVILSVLSLPAAYRLQCPSSDFGGIGFIFGRFAANTTAILQSEVMLAVAAVLFAAYLLVGNTATAFLGQRLSPWRLDKPTASD